MSVQGKVRGGMQALGQIFWPGWGPRVEVGGLHPVVRWALHLALLLLILLLLFLLNQYLEISGWIPGRFRILAKSWLPILFLLLYGMTWIAWWLWVMVGRPPEGPEFPDILAAWQKGVEALNRAGIPLTETPLFLILGKPESGEEALFTASQLQLQVRMVPQDPTAPIHISANRDGIYITCPDASLLSYYAGQLTATPIVPDASGALAAMPSGGAEDGLDATMRPDQATAMPEMRAFREQFIPLFREGRSLSPVERREARMLMRSQQPRTSFMKQGEPVQYYGARLAYLCQLLLQDRQPRPAMNGILVLIPFAGLDLDQDAADTGDACLRDLTTVQQVTRTICPRFAAVVDLETARGFREFLQQFSSQERRPRLGQRCPLVPDMSRPAMAMAGASGSDSFAELFNGLGTWVSSSVVPTWVYKKFQVEKPEEPDPTRIIETNARMFLFLEELRVRQRRLGLVLSRAMSPLPGSSDPPWFGGCYLAATGADAAFEQAFVPGVFRRLIEEQDFVSWTQQAFEEDARALRTVSICYTILGGLAVAGLLLLVWALMGAGRR